MAHRLVRAQNTCKDIRIHSFHHTHTHTCTYVSTHAHTHTHTHRNTHTHTPHTQTHTHTHAHTHTQQIHALPHQLTPSPLNTKAPWQHRPRGWDFIHFIQKRQIHSYPRSRQATSSSEKAWWQKTQPQQCDFILFKFQLKATDPQFPQINSSHLVCRESLVTKNTATAVWFYTI